MLSCCLQQGETLSVTLYFTPGQLRGENDIPQETYRHWKKALAPLRRETGHRPCFTAGDLLAVAVVRVLTVDSSIRVGALSTVAEPLFKLCNGAFWPTLERSNLIVDLVNARIQVLPELERIAFEVPVMVVVPLRPLVSRLREALLADGRVGNQEMLPFPPTPLPSKVGAASSGGRS
jgi:hypothetical protein